MFILSKLFTSLLLPPGLFVILIFASLFIKNRKNMRRCLLIIAAVIYLLSIRPVKEALLLPLENAYPVLRQLPKNAGAAVVLGGGNYLYPKISPAEDSVKRVIEAARIRRMIAIPLILSGGKSPLENSGADAESMKRVLNSLGISGNIFLDTKSLNTFGNAKYSAIVLKKLKIDKPVILITSAYHMKRAVLSFKNNGINVYPDPVDFHTDRTEYTLFSFFPTMKDLSDSFRALHEYIGIIYYHLL